MPTSRSVRLIPVFTSLGVKDAFTGRADLTGISPQAALEGLEVSDIVHVANIGVDEDGTTAAAATAVAAHAVSASPRWPKCPDSVTLDRPFVS